MAENFTAKQREIVARKMGYDGPMQMFDEYLASTPSDAQRYAAVTSKFAERMAKGGMATRRIIKKYAAGGAVGLSYQTLVDSLRGSPLTAAERANSNPQFQATVDYVSPSISDDMVQRAYQEAWGRPAEAWEVEAWQGTAGDATLKDPSTFDDAFIAPYVPPVAPVVTTPKPRTPTPPVIGKPSGGSPTSPVVPSTIPIGPYNPADRIGNDVRYDNQPQTEPARLSLAGGAVNTGVGTIPTGGGTGGQTNTPLAIGGAGVGAPSISSAPGYAAQTTSTAGLTATAPTSEAVSATPQQITETATATPSAPITAATVTPTFAAPSIAESLAAMPDVQGAVSDAATAKAVTQDPTTTAVRGVQAAQATAGTVAPVAQRTVQAGEMVAGPSVDMARVEDTLARTQAAQGVVAEEMTVQGQLNKLLTNFDAGKPPAWAAASMRAATAQMAARGVGASSMAGQAIIQATLEAASPIAAADAKIQETMALQNLSNRQAIALDLGKQRAAFLGQEFDQAFQTRVKNAATISDIANRNFDATVTIALENARIASTTNLTNLSARNALVLAEAAQVASLETSNMNNRQLVAVDTAKAFLNMDLKNLDITQQTSVFKAKTIADSLTSDVGFANASSATNASNKLEADKISATLALTASQYNASETNKIKVANMNAANELIKFNAQESNDRSEFNSRMSAEINVANAKILADVSTANTAAINAANAVNAKNATDLTSAAYAQQSQTYRDLLSYSFKSGENEKDRITQVAVASINKSAATSAAETAADATSSAAWGRLAYEVIKDW